MDSNGKSGLTGSDVLAIDANRNGDMFGGGAGFFWVFALLLLNNGNWGGNGNFSEELQISQNAQTQQLQMSNMQQELLNNKFDLAQTINGQTDTLIAQNNTNLINAIQGFNSLGLQVTNQTNALSSQIQSLSAQMNQCCCDIKTQMLQDRLADALADKVRLENALDNANQSQYILGQLGRFVAWAGTGSQSYATTVS